MTGARGEASGQVRLRQVTSTDAELLDRWASDPVAHGAFNHFDGGPGVPAARRIADAELDGRPLNEMIVEEGGRAVGHVSWHATHWGPDEESTALTIGISLVPEARGHGVGSRAQRMLADFLFHTTRVHRVEASTDVENLAEQRALEKAGFVREGVARQAQWRAGAWHDMVLYGRVRPEAPGTTRPGSAPGRP